MTAIIEALKTYFLTYDGLKDDAPVWIDFVGQKPPGYALVPLAGTIILEQYINGDSQREYSFAFQSMESTADEAERIESQTFYEALAEWLEEQTEAGVFPTLGEGQEATEIEALGWGFLLEHGESNTGVYQIQCRLIYEQVAR